MKDIPLTKGQVAVVDDEDYEELNKFRWYSLGYPGKMYAARYGGYCNGKTLHIRMHREILKAPDGIEVDHINGNRLDNRKENLRLATRAQNGRNRGKFIGTMYSCFKGVTWHKRDKCWQGTIRVDGVFIHLGSFQTEREAALAYNKAAIKYHGEYAKLNVL